MAAKVSAEDLRAMFENTLCMYNNKPYYIESINARYQADCVNLLTQRNETIAMDETTFSAPLRRIGMVNTKKSVVYVSRKPVRRYKAGLCRNNTVFETAAGVRYPHGAGTTIAELHALKSVAIADAMFGKYPTIPECIEALNEERAVAIAFDHQFALTEDGQVIYKTNVVGTFENDAKTPYDLVFHDKYKYLISLLDNNHEKSISAA